MDDLEFRRRIYADPKHQDSELKQAMLQDPAKRKFPEHMQQFDNQIEDALKIDVPVFGIDELFLALKVTSYFTPSVMIIFFGASKFQSRPLFT